jgi:hypothetical protein
VLLVIGSVVVSAFMVLFYNWVARRIGGIEVEISGK